MSATRASMLVSALLFGTALLVSPAANAQDSKHYRFAHDQQLNSGYSVAYDIFSAKLKELSGGKMLVDQFPGAQLGQEPQLLQLVKSGDLDFAIVSSANTATISPQAGVMSLHFLFRGPDHMVKALGDEKVFEAIRDMIDQTTQGIHVIGLGTQGLRNMYSKKEIHKIEDIKGLKIRVQATATEDALFPAYGAQTVHMPFGNVYTSLQTGVIDMAENGVSIYQLNKHYEAAPVMSLTQHEANCNMMWISDKMWKSLSAEQQGWVQAAADEVAREQPAKALALEADALTKLQKMGVKFVLDVDKTGFIKIAEPIQEKLAGELGPYALRILKHCRAVPA
jgi:tripartite ATP-independent transporter DctP family solute receptor